MDRRDGRSIIHSRSSRYHFIREQRSGAMISEEGRGGERRGVGQVREGCIDGEGRDGKEGSEGSVVE